MAALRKSVSSLLLGTLAASCLLLLALWVQGGAAVPISSHCTLDESNFQQPYIINRTFMLAKEASLADNNTDVRLIGEKLFRGVNMRERCYLMKQVLNFTLEEVLLPRSNRFQPYMQEVVAFLARLSNKLNQCHVESNDQHVQRNVQKLKDTVKKLQRAQAREECNSEKAQLEEKLLGESGEIKAIGELDLLFMELRNACI